MRPIIPALIVTAAVVLVGVVVLQKRGHSRAANEATAPAPAAALPVDVYVVQPETQAVAVPATGRLAARESVDLVSELSRRLVRVHVEEGRQVKQGEVLFELDSADLRAQLAQLKVQLTLAQTNAERQKKLAEEGLSTALESQAAVAKHDELLAAQRVLEVTLSKTVIRAPFSGSAGLRRVSQGAWVSSNTVLVSLHDTSQLKLDFSVPERYASLLAPGKEFTFRAEGRGELMKGTIAAFEPAIEQSSRSVLVRGVVQNEKNLLPGTFASVDLPLSAEEVLLVPAIALIPGAQGRQLYLEKNGAVDAVRVEVGPRSGERVQITSGIAPGDRVIVSNLLRLRPGAAVTAKPQGSQAP